MKTMRLLPPGLSSAMVAVALVLGPVAASAGPQLIDVRDTCTAINCNAMTIRGMSQPEEPFVVQIYADWGDCLRIDFTKQGKDAEALLVMPNINDSVYSDDRNEANDRPLIVVDPAPYSGWYTLLAGHWKASEKTVKFYVDYGRYDSGNPNCQVVTNQIRVENTSSGKSLSGYPEPFGKSE